MSKALSESDERIRDAVQALETASEALRGICLGDIPEHRASVVYSEAEEIEELAHQLWERDLSLHAQEMIRGDDDE